MSKGDFLEKTIESIRLNSSDFSTVVSGLENVSNEIRVLWLEIYQNAISDRENANKLFNNLIKEMEKSDSNVEANHALHGTTLTKYLERMHHSNQQLIKLSEMVAEAKKREEELNPDDVFSELENIRS